MRDYALLLGMPGTGKTTTIVHIIKVRRIAWMVLWLGFEAAAKVVHAASLPASGRVHTHCSRACECMGAGSLNSFQITSLLD